MRNYGALPNSSEGDHLYDGIPSHLQSSDNNIRRGDERKTSRFYLFMQVSIVMLLVVAASVGTITYYSRDHAESISSSSQISKSSVKTTKVFSPDTSSSSSDMVDAISTPVAVDPVITDTSHQGNTVTEPVVVSDYLIQEKKDADTINKDNVVVPDATNQDSAGTGPAVVSDATNQDSAGIGPAVVPDATNQDSAGIGPAVVPDATNQDSAGIGPAVVPDATNQDSAGIGPAVVPDATNQDSAGIGPAVVSEPLIQDNVDSVSTIPLVNAESPVSGHNSDGLLKQDPQELYGAGASSITLTTRNEYGVLAPDYPWLSADASILFEPYKVMTVKAAGFELRQSNRYKWVLRRFAGDMEKISEQFTTTPTAQFKHEGTSNLKLEFHVVNAESETILKKVFVVYTKYVKREMRNLSVEDREKFLDTAVTLWKTSTYQGRLKYGDLYTSIDTYVLEHAIASNDIMCDQFHEGSGFLTHHMALQASFDASLKSIDPSVVLPYWDFTIEGETILSVDESPNYFMDVSPFLSNEWFGAVDESGHIINSRWKDVKFPASDGAGRVKPNSFGIIRSYWNNNNDHYISRFPFNVAGEVVENKRIPNCATHFDVLNTSTLGAFQLLSPAYGHGPMHVQMGGVTGPVIQDMKDFRERWASILMKEYTDDELKEKGLNPDTVRSYDETYPLLGFFNYKVVGEFFHIYRSLWRSHMCSRDSTVQLLQCPEECSPNTDLGDCRCKIPALDSGETDWENVYHCVIFNEAIRAKFNKAFPRDFLEDMVLLFANTQVVEGEMLEAASPVDPLFWMIHPVINRLEHAKRLQNIKSMGGIPFHKWSEEEETWLSYSYYNFDEGVKASIPDGNYCPGHAAEDAVLPDALPLSRGFHQRVDRNKDGIISNFEFYEGTDPNDPDKLEYVFENFNWPHCSEEGIAKGQSLIE